MLVSSTVHLRYPLEMLMYDNYYYPGSISDGRLTIGITKFDILLADVENDGDTMKDELKKNTVKSIVEATGVPVDKSEIIPLCNRWALTGSKLNSCLLRGIRDRERKERCLRILEQCSGSIDVACGEGQTMKEAIRLEFKNGQDIVNALENVSGIAELKSRLVIFLNIHQS